MRQNSHEKSEDSTNSNRAVRYVERGKRPGAVKDLNEISHGAMGNSIIKVTRCAAEDKPKPQEAGEGRVLPSTLPEGRRYEAEDQEDTPIKTALRKIGLPSASIPKAAPGFSVWTIRSQPGMTGVISNEPIEF